MGTILDVTFEMLLDVILDFMLEADAAEHILRSQCRRAGKDDIVHGRKKITEASLNKMEIIYAKV